MRSAATGSDPSRSSLTRSAVSESWGAVVGKTLNVAVVPSGLN